MFCYKEINFKMPAVPKATPRAPQGHRCELWSRAGDASAQSRGSASTLPLAAPLAQEATSLF